MPEFGLDKSEKLCSQIAIDRLFASGASAIAYPIRMVYAESDREYGAPVQFFISIPKKRIRKAVGRVLMRRRIREAYRLNRSFIPGLEGKKFNVAFIYVANEIVEYSRVER